MVKVMKTVVLLDDVIINVGDWEYHYNTEGEPINPLPEGAIIEQREMVYSIERGWHLASAPQTLSQEERITELENIILTLLEVL